MDRLISEKAIIDTIKTWATPLQISNAESMQDLWVEDVCRLVKAIPSADNWIPVSERLPKWDIECLVVDDKGEFGVGFYRDDVGAWDSPSWGWLERKDEVDNHDAYYMPCGIGKVIAWMPLPKPYVPDTNIGNMVEPQESEDKE